LIREVKLWSHTLRNVFGPMRTVKLRIPKKVVRPRISANVSVSNKSIV
jgi:hypothetical protein